MDEGNKVLSLQLSHFHYEQMDQNDLFQGSWDRLEWTTFLPLNDCQFPERGRIEIRTYL